jgi:hypothetical protein
VGMIVYSGVLAMCYGMVLLVLLVFLMILPNGRKGMLCCCVRLLLQAIGG